MNSGFMRGVIFKLTLSAWARAAVFRCYIEDSMEAGPVLRLPVDTPGFGGWWWLG